VPELLTATLVEDAARRHEGVAAFNVITLEHAEAIVAAAEQGPWPVILQVSENAVRYHAGAVGPLAAALRAMAAAAAVPVSLHLDHVEDPALLRRGADAGFSAVMVDAGRLPYDQNVSQTAAATRWLQERNIYVEAELGYVGGKASQADSAHAPGVRTDPEQAASFVAATGVDALAVAVGTSHAMTTRTASIDLELVKALRERLPVPLVLHGSSGVPDDELRRAVRAGITKVNIGTALNVAFTGAVRSQLEGGSGDSARADVDPRGYLDAARTAMTATAAAMLRVVGSP